MELSQVPSAIIQRRFRRATKERIVASLGGKCVCCGYDKYYGSLALHHLDPEKKEFSFSSMIQNPKKWETIVNEIRKCVLVCHNCHSEIHGNIQTIPENAPRFNEKFVVYKYPKSIKTDACPICKNPKPVTSKHCSQKCSHKHQQKVDWDSINLKELVESIRNWTKIGKMLNVSAGAVKKAARKIGYIQLPK